MQGSQVLWGGGGGGGGGQFPPCPYASYGPGCQGLVLAIGDPDSWLDLNY